MARVIANFLRRMDTFFGDASWLTRCNSARSAFGALRETETPVPPIRLQVEVTNRCNINCIMCSRHKHALTLGDISSSLYDKISAISARAQETILFGYGEPLISKAFYELLPRIHSSRFGFFTNGMTMTPPVLDRIRALTRSKLHSVTFSVDGGTKETFERIRERAKFDRVLANLAAIAQTRREKNLDFDLRVAFVAMKDNIRELPALINLLEPLGVDSLFVSNLVVWDEEFRDQSLVYAPEECRAAFAEARAAAEGKRLFVDLPYDFAAPDGAGQGGGEKLPRCRMPWLYVMVSFEGDVRACCFAPEAMTMGSLHTSGFEEIWRNEKFRTLRRSLRDGKDCAACLACENRFRSVPSPSDEATYVKLTPRTK